MSTALRTRPRVLVSALVCSALFTPLVAAAQTSPAAPPSAGTTTIASPSHDASQSSSIRGGTLPAISVTAQSEMQTRTLPSYKFTAPLLDTPRSVTVIPEEVIREKNVTTFADALRTVPGITFLGGDAAANPSADRPVIRGFESRNSIFVDGLRDSGVQNRETFDIEQISVVKGPDSVYAGRGP